MLTQVIILDEKLHIPPSNQDKIIRSAQFIADRWHTGNLETELPNDLLPNSLNEGYSIQNELVRQLDLTILGWKLAAASDNQIAQSNLPRGLVGRLFRERSYQAGDIIQTPTTGALTIECEVGLRLSRDIHPHEALPIDNRLIDEVTINFEIVRSRFVDRRAIGWPSFVADNAAFEAIVIGDRLSTEITDELLISLQRECFVELDGNNVSSPLVGKNGINPMTSLRYLIDHAREQNLSLLKGQRVTTGAFCKPFDIPGREHEIRLNYPNYSLEFSI
ncbi:hypothetical protein [Oceanospirillum sanctuarii]|uniref:hypothetical protein n=1 Tax=Oceanospirillum sanctuarii TaxID=1434821 RepID=UPI000A3C12B1|nr:hypothetical protein [Oceanospirillum sanctuarii]